MSRMLAVRWYGPDAPLRLERIALPRLRPGEALVRVIMAGVCHTELHMLDGTLNLGVVPLTPGHEIVGMVEEVRGESQQYVGQRVLLYYYSPCGKCRYCQAGREQLCPNMARQIGFTADGGYAEYVAAPIASLITLPDGLDSESAAGLACGAATALHAAKTVARLRVGERAVVIGLGGVGFYLVQLARLLGAEVSVVSRSREKLALAGKFGVEDLVWSGSSDVLGEIYAATDGEGADVVFDLAATAETMAQAVRMLARGGRLILVGYGAERFAVPPLWLVLRELQVLGALGATRAETEEVVSLAAQGLLRSVHGEPLPLEDVVSALVAVREGKVMGRALLKVGGERRPVGREVVLEGNETVAVVLSEGFVKGEAESSDRTEYEQEQDRRGQVKEQEVYEKRPDIRAKLWHSRDEERPFQRDLLNVIAAGVDGPLAHDDSAFDVLARAIFRFQYEHNAIYQQFCDFKHQTPETVRHWSEIPAVPIGAFKEAQLVTEPPNLAVAVFMSSGTTRPEQRSRHYHPSLEAYDANALANFAHHVLPDGARMPILVLNPPPDQLPHSSLAHWLGLMVKRFGTEGSGYFVSEGGLEHERVARALEEFSERGKPVVLLGTTFAFIHLFDWAIEAGRSWRLAVGSRVMDTGGVKGRSREITREEFGHVCREVLGVPLTHQLNMYGLTELSTQFLDSTLREWLREGSRVTGDPSTAWKTVPAWARTRVLDPETLTDVPKGTVGVLWHFDLLNRSSVSAILTEDVGVAQGEGFQVLGRVPGSQARGCSIAMDELLEATRRQ